MGAMSRNKGKVGEREVAALLREYGFEASRGVQHQGGTDSPDVKHDLPDIAGGPAHLEVKRVEALNLYNALDQADEDGGPEKTPIVFHRRNGKRWVVIMYAEDFLNEIALRSR